MDFHCVIRESTTLRQRCLMRQIISLFARLIVGGVFIYASFDKIAFPYEFAKIVKNYNILPDNIGLVFAYVLPWVELALGIFLVVGLFIRPTAFSLSFILSMFMAAIIIKSIEGNIENCGCFSTIEGKGGQSLLYLIIRNAILLLLCIFIMRSNKGRAQELNKG